MKLELVAFEDGSFGIRRKYWLFPCEFYDFRLYNPDDELWWTINSKWFIRGDCKTTKEIATRVYGEMTKKPRKPDYGTVVKCDCEEK